MNTTWILPAAAAVAGAAVVYFAERKGRRALLDDLANLQTQLDAAKAAPVAPPRSPIPREELLAQLANTLGLRSSEDQVLWSAFGTFWGANAILLVALFSTGKLPDSPGIAPAVSAIGLAISLVWHWVQQRALGHVERYELLAKRIEERLQVEESLSTSARRNVGDYDLLKRGPKARDVMRWCSTGASLLWALALIGFIAEWAA